MAEYVTEEAMFSLPDGWVDGSTNVLEIGEPAAAYRVMILRVPSAGRTLDGFVKLQRSELERRMAYFQALGEGERTVQGKAGKTLRATYRDDEMTLYQHRVVFELGASFVAITIIGTPMKERETDAMLDQLLASLKFRSSAN